LEEGGRIEADISALQDAIFGDHRERSPTPRRREDDVWVMAHGTMVGDRGSGTHMEVKLGLVFSGVERTGKERRRLLERHYRRVIGYVGNDARAIANYRIVPLASSGPMEKGVDIIICRRFKTRGMSRFRQGVSRLLHLKLLRLNGSWDRYWARADDRGAVALACRGLSLSTED
jgi:hypothetical protein